MNYYNKRIEKRLLADCLGGITWQSDPSDEGTFLQESQISEAQKAITDVQDLFPDITSAFKPVDTEASIAFTYNSATPIVDKSTGINKNISKIEENLGGIAKQIASEGSAHRKEEAVDFYKKVREHLMDLDVKIDNAVTAYNNKLDEEKSNFMMKAKGYETVNEGKGRREYKKPIYPTQSEADDKYGGHVRENPDNPYSSSLSNTAKIAPTPKSIISPECENLLAAKKEYNECANSQGKKAEDFLKETGATAPAASSPYATYARVSSGDAGISDDYYDEYNSNHDKPMDVHYYGTVGLTDENGNPVLDKDGNQVRVPVYYDANEHNETYTGDWMNTKDSSRLFTVVDGEICYLTNESTTHSNDDTSNWMTGWGNYDISIAVDSNGIPTEDGTVYCNHDPINKPSPGSGGWNDTLYFKTPGNDGSESETHTVDWGTVQRTTDNDE